MSYTHLAYRNVLLDPTARKYSVQLRTQTPFAEQCEHNRIGQHRFQCLFAVHLAVDSQQNLYIKPMKTPMLNIKTNI